MLEAGAHFGHQTHRWNPKMKKYIFGARNGIYIIDLQQTVPLLKDAYNFVSKISAKGEKILFVGTKNQAQSVIQEEAARSGRLHPQPLAGRYAHEPKPSSRAWCVLRHLSAWQPTERFSACPKKKLCS